MFLFYLKSEVGQLWYMCSFQLCMYMVIGSIIK